MSIKTNAAFAYTLIKEINTEKGLDIFLDSIGFKIDSYDYLSFKMKSWSFSYKKSTWEVHFHHIYNIAFIKWNNLDTQNTIKEIDLNFNNCEDFIIFVKEKMSSDIRKEKIKQILKEQ